MIPKHIQKSFDALCKARDERALCLTECRDAMTGEVRYVLAAVGGNGQGHVVKLFGHLCIGDPAGDYDPPSQL